MFIALQCYKYIFKNFVANINTKASAQGLTKADFPSSISQSIHNQKAQSLSVDYNYVKVNGSGSNLEPDKGFKAFLNYNLDMD